MSRLYNDKFAFVKPSLDAHTMGINSIAELLKDCEYEVLIADEVIEKAMNDIRYEVNQRIIVDWILANKINSLGVSYRLDQDVAVTLLGYLMNTLRNSNLLSYQG